MQMLMAQEACEAYEIGPARKLLKHFQPGSDIHNALVIHRERNHQGNMMRQDKKRRRKKKKKKRKKKEDKQVGGRVGPDRTETPDKFRF